LNGFLRGIKRQFPTRKTVGNQKPLKAIQAQMQLGLLLTWVYAALDRNILKGVISHLFPDSVTDILAIL
jgi:hypothetical protein